MVALPCWSKLLCGQIWYVPAITAGPWWRGMLHSNSKLCLRFFFAVSNYYVIAVCILAWPGLHTFKIGVWEVWGGGVPLYNRPRCIWMTANVSTLVHLSAFKFLSGRCLCMVPSLSNRVCLENLQHFLNLFQDLCCLFFSNLQYGVIWTDTVWSSFFSEPPPLTDFFVTSFLCSRSIARI